MIDWDNILKPGAKLYAGGTNPADPVPCATITKIITRWTIYWTGPLPGIGGRCSRGWFIAMIRGRLRSGGRFVTADGQTLTHADLASQTNRIRDAIDAMDRVVRIMWRHEDRELQDAMQKLREVRP